MPFKQAFSVKNNPVVASANYHPSNNTWSNTQASAQSLVRQQAQGMNSINQQLAGFKTTSWQPLGFGDIINQQFVGESPLTGVVTLSGGDSPWNAAYTAVGILAADDVTGVGTFDDIAIPFVFAVAATYDLTQRVYLTYTLTGPLNQKYAGRASGFGDPYYIMMRRYSGHHMKYFGYSNPTLDVSRQGVSAYPAIRGREQQLIDFYGGVGSPNVGNSIRGVGYYNLSGRFFHGQSNLYFGPLAP
jgi:hypothetical protein